MQNIHKTTFILWNEIKYGPYSPTSPSWGLSLYQKWTQCLPALLKTWIPLRPPLSSWNVLTLLPICTLFSKIAQKKCWCKQMAFSDLLHNLFWKLLVRKVVWLDSSSKKVSYIWVVLCEINLRTCIITNFRLPTKKKKNSVFRKYFSMLAMLADVSSSETL